MAEAFCIWNGLNSSNPTIKTVTFPLFRSACLNRFLFMSIYFDSVDAALHRNSKGESKLNVAALISCNFLISSFQLFGATLIQSSDNRSTNYSLGFLLPISKRSWCHFFFLPSCTKFLPSFWTPVVLFCTLHYQSSLHCIFFYLLNNPFIKLVLPFLTSDHYQLFKKLPHYFMITWVAKFFTVFELRTTLRSKTLYQW